MFLRRLAADQPLAMRLVNSLRTFATRADVRDFSEIRNLLASDPSFRAFHEGRSGVLPEFYRHLYKQRLGRFAELLPADASQPMLEPPAAPRVPKIQEIASFQSVT